MEHEDIRKIKKKSVASAASLVFQSSYSAILGFAAFFLLTIKSGIFLLGIYNTVLASISFLNYFTNLGLAAALIHKKDVKSVDLNSAFFVQFFLVTLAVIGGFLGTELIFKGYENLPPNTIYLYWAVLLSFFVSSLKTIPSVLLEKNVEIYKIVLVQSIENTLFYLTIIILTFFNMDISALIIAVLLRSIVGCIIIFILKPWFPRFELSFSITKDLLRYGIPFQGNSFLALLKDDLMIIFLGRTLGFEKLGIITFGKKYAEMTLRLVTDNINRVSFPLFSQFQQKPDLLKKSLEKVLFYGTLMVFPVLIGTMFVFESVLKIVPGYYVKWHLALPSFYFFSLSAIGVSLTTPFINLFNAVGKVKKSLFFMVLWTVIMWLLIPPSIGIFGYNGVAPVFFISSLTVIFVIIEGKKIVQTSIRHALRSVFIASSIMSLYLVCIRLLITNPISHILLSISGSGLIYLLLITRLEHIRISDIRHNLLGKL